MRVLLVNYRYFISGGPEKYMFNIKRLLEKNGHEVIPFSVHSNKNEPTEYSKYFVEPIGSRDATYYDEVKKSPRVIWQLLSRSIYSLEVKKAIKKEIKEVKPDLVYVIHFVNKLSPSVITGAKEMGVPVVMRISDYFILCPRFDFLRDKTVCEDCLSKGYSSCIKNRCVKGSLFASVIRVFSMKVHKMMHIYDKIDAFISPSNYMKQKLVDNGFDEKKITYIPTFTESVSEVGEPVIGEYGLYFGRLSKEKGVETVIKAYEKLPNNKLVIMGDYGTEEGTRLKQYIEDNKIENISFIGFKGGEELEEVVRNARFIVIPSIWYDNLPNTALEAFLYSKPVIASNIGSLPELVIDGKNGYLFETDNVDDLVDKIKKLDDDETIIRLGENSRERYEDIFSPKWHYEKLLNVFIELVEKK